MKITTKTTIKSIRNALSADGFSPIYASAVKRAALAGCLLWSSERLVTTDSSRIDARPVR